MKKKIITLLLFILLLFPLTTSLFERAPKVNGNNNFELLDYNYNSIPANQYYYYNNVHNSLINNNQLPNDLGNKTIMIESAVDLYNMSMFLQYHNEDSSNTALLNLRQSLLNQNFTLGNDIDYSVMKAQRFVPIGYFINDNVKLEFAGTFDGRGFEIKNLYFSVFDQYKFEDNEEQTKVPSPYFSMFNFNSGTITNFGLVNPIIDLENELPDLEYFAFLVGENKVGGVVEKVYVEDNRGKNNGGIRAYASQVTEENMKSASGIVHTNNGTFTNSYYAGASVVNSAFSIYFHENPLLFTNNGTYSNLVYANIYDNTATGSYGTMAANLQSSSTLTDFYYYANDGYPKLFGLDKVGSEYIIRDAKDFITFSKLIDLRTIVSGVTFSNSKYLIENDINMNDTSRLSYKAPMTMFEGELRGQLNGSYYSQINNLVISKANVDGTEVYYGLFNKVSGVIKDIAFYNFSFDVDATYNTEHISSEFYVGTVAAKLENAKVSNIYIDTTIDLENKNIGSFAVGALAGEASGNVSNIYVSNNSEITIGSQNYNNAPIGENFYLGGVIGKTGSAKLTALNLLNRANIESLATTINISNNGNFYLGGVFGYVNNTAAARHDIGNIQNYGDLTFKNINTNNPRTLNYYIGGAIGYSGGTNYTFSSNYGHFVNDNEFIYTGSNSLNSTRKNVYIAGSLNSNHSEAIEFVKLDSKSDLIFSNSDFQIAALVNHLSSNNLTVSQSKTAGSMSSNINQNFGVAINMINTSPVLQLNYVEIYTDFTFTSPGVYNTHLYLAGITLHEKTNFLNVTHSANMNVTVNTNNNTKNNSSSWISGFTPVLASGYYIKNSVNKGEINVTHSGNSNLYVGGLVNRNLSGDLHNQDSQTRPRATIGVLNSINLANITSVSNNAGNSFVGGLVTLNGDSTGGSIQDAVNAGTIIAKNGNSSAANPTFGNDDVGGVVTNYKSGVTAGGIAAAQVFGQARIYDTSNNGDVIAIARYFARSGGILGSALPDEFFSNTGGLFISSTQIYSNNTTASNASNIDNSIVSNGINYAKIQAVTLNIGSYGNNTNTTTTIYFSTDGGVSSNLPGLATWSSVPTRTSTQERPGIYSSAGGVVGYGLPKMYRMINHGQISATDVAGGVVGATSVKVTKQVYINTAINYGEIKAINNTTANYNNIYANNLATNSHFYADGHSFIFPNTRSDIRILPENKRGFGGVFGRLQRATSQRMQATSSDSSFDFVVNMNPNIDLIGRLDQVYNPFSSSRFFEFAGAKYYSARPNDTTQAVFTGYEYKRTKGTTGRMTHDFKDYIYETKIEDGVQYYRYKVTGGTRYSPTSQSAFHNPTIETVFYRIGQTNDEQVHLRTSNFNRSSHSGYSSSSLPAEDWSNWMFDDNSPKPAVRETIIGNPGWSGNSRNNYIGGIKVPEITENPAIKVPGRDYVYSPYFEMRDENTILQTGEAITSFIYYAANDLLADHFQPIRPYGMYVLASSSGSNFGAVLPKNFSLLDLRRIDTDVSPNNLDYNNVAGSYLITIDSINDSDIFNNYESMYQTTYNDKSALLENNQLVHIHDGSNNVDGFLSTNSFTGNDVIITINSDLLPGGFNNNSGFEMLEAIIPEGALIAKPGATQAELLAFRQANPFAKIATGSLAPDLTGWTLNQGSRIIGEFTSYSQAAIYDNNFTDIYQTEYTLRVLVDNTNRNNPTLYRRSIDGENYATTGVNGNPPSFTITSSIGLEFREGEAALASHKLANGYIIDNFVSLYYNNGGTYVEVDPSYYTIDSIPKDGRYFATTIRFSEELRNGSYQIRYKFYNNDTVKNINITYNPSRTYDFLEFKPYTSTTYDGSTADINFNYDLFDIHNVGNDYFNRTTNSLVPVYNKDYYQYDIYFLENFVMSDFFEFDNITHSQTLVNGYVTHTLNFRQGGTTIVTKYIEERKLSPNYYKDGSTLPKSYNNGLGIDTVSTTARREANNTIFTLDYLLDPSFYNADDFIITVTGVESFTVTDSSDYIYYEFNNGLDIIMTDQAMPGMYYIDVKYKKDNDTNLNAGYLVVEKLPGTSGYLTNIKFSSFVIGNEYPYLGVTNNNNTVIDNNFNMNVYYGGIDYNEADSEGKQYFRIDGQVAKVPLIEYHPYNIVQFLPDGAKIKRKIYNQNGTFYWSSLVDKTNTEAEIAEALNTNFTIHPDPTKNYGEDDKVYVEYMVVPENQLSTPVNSQNGVTYFISVTDVDYTFLAVFNFMYKDPVTNQISAIEDISTFDNELLILNINNFKVSNGGVILTDDQVYEGINYNSIQFDKLELLQTKITMYYFVNPATKGDYIYQLGNNLSGYYQFALSLPPNYKYSIYLNHYEGVQSYELPKFGDKIENAEGNFYYINTSSITRTRYFYVVIEDAVVENNDWGITDNNNTWD